MIDTITRGEGHGPGNNPRQQATTHLNTKQQDQEQEVSEQEVIRPWSREEAETWRRKNPSLSPWRVVAVQTAMGLACGAVIWAITQRSEAAWSALYGAAVVVGPGALLARGMTRDLSKVKGAVGVAVFSFMLWEMVKIGVAVAMLALAPRVVADLSWPALLATMIVCVKMNWLALLWQRRRVVTDTTQRV